MSGEILTVVQCLQSNTRSHTHQRILILSFIASPLDTNGTRESRKCHVDLPKKGLFPRIRKLPAILPQPSRKNKTKDQAFSFQSPTAKLLVICTELPTLEKQVLTLLQHVNNKKEFSQALDGLQVYGVLTAAWDMHLFAMQPVFDEDHNSIVYQWRQHPRTLDIQKASNVVVAFELFKRMSKSSNYLQQHWQELGPCHATHLSCYLPTFCEIPKGRATHTADTPTKAPKDKTQSKKDTSDGQATGPGRNSGDREKGKDKGKGHGKDSVEDRKRQGGGTDMQDAGFIPLSDSVELRPEASALLEIQNLLPADLLAEIRGWVPKVRAMTALFL
ncbi:hypothetical protein QOT17_019090 [Balamuthia mandrillaris]